MSGVPRFHRELATELPDLRHRLRRLRWFLRAHESCRHRLERSHGLRFEPERNALATLFFDWMLPIDESRELAEIDWWDYVAFAAGVALRDLLHHRPVHALPPGRGLGGDDDTLAAVAREWPEGFLHVVFCLSAIGALEIQELGAARELDPCTEDPRFWWSLRENIAEDADQAICFLDRMLGREPNWELPTVAFERPAMRRALDRESS